MWVLGSESPHDHSEVLWANAVIASNRRPVCIRRKPLSSNAQELIVGEPSGATFAPRLYY